MIPIKNQGLMTAEVQYCSLTSSWNIVTMYSRRTVIYSLSLLALFLHFYFAHTLIPREQTTYLYATAHTNVHAEPAWVCTAMLNENKGVTVAVKCTYRSYDTAAGSKNNSVSPAMLAEYKKIWHNQIIESTTYLLQLILTARKKH